MRLVSLVPSVTETVAALGAAEALVGVTDWCVVGAPDGAIRVGGTKNPDVSKVVALRPDVVVVNQEENRAEDVVALRAAGVEVLVTYPRKVPDVPPLIRLLGELLDRAETAAGLADTIDTALGAIVPLAYPIPALTLIWRKPWMAVGPGTYADDLLTRCGFTNVLATHPDRYPKVHSEQLRHRGSATAHIARPDVVLLPSEPYVFGEKDLDAVRDLVGPEPAIHFVDGQLLTWHGPRTVQAVGAFSALAQTLAESER